MKSWSFCKLKEIYFVFSTILWINLPLAWWGLSFWHNAGATVTKTSLLSGSISSGNASTTAFSLISTSSLKRACLSATRFLRSVSCWAAVLVDLLSFLSLMILRMSFRPPLVGDSFSSPEPEPEAFSCGIWKKNR